MSQLRVIYTGRESVDREVTSYIQKYNGPLIIIPALSLRNLGLDSLEQVELVQHIEEAFDVSVDDVMFGSLHELTLTDFIDTVDRFIAAKHRPQIEMPAPFSLSEREAAIAGANAVVDMMRSLSAKHSHGANSALDKVCKAEMEVAMKLANEALRLTVLKYGG